MDEKTVGFWLSLQQKHAYAITQSQPGAITRGVVRIRGAVDEARLRWALGLVVDRHEILRTVFRRPAGMKVPFQVVLKASEPSWCASIESVEGEPVVRACFSRGEAGDSELVLELPAVCADEYTLHSFVRELGLIYSGREAELVREPLQYRQYAQWQMDLHGSDDEDAQEGREYWERVRTGMSEISLPSYERWFGPRFQNARSEAHSKFRG